MSQPVITADEVARIIERRKFVHRVVQSNLSGSSAKSRKQSYVEPDEKRIIYEVRFLDMKEHDARLQFHARIEKSISGVVKPKPGISLKLSGRRIRGVNWNMRHDCIVNGLPHGIVRGWHEKIWTNTDEDKYIVDINAQVKNIDLTSMIQFCCKRWNIDLPDTQRLLIGDL